MIAILQPPAGPLPLPRHLLPERSSPSRVRCAAQNPRAPDRSGPFRKLTSCKGKGATAKSDPFLVHRPVTPPVGRPRDPKTRAPPLDHVNNLQA
jgi:hypothetical protein